MANQGRKKKTILFYALKSYEKIHKEFALNEIRITQDLRHNNISILSNWYETKNHFWIIYDYLSGETLAETVKQEISLSEDFLRQILEMLLAGLYYLHGNGIAFFNFAPIKITYDEFGCLKYSDFSEAKMLGESFELPSDLSYIAPELVLGKSKVDVKSDFWSLGCLIYELVTGHYPFDLSDSYAATSEKYFYDDKKLEKYSEDFQNLLKSFLRFKTNERTTWNDILNANWTRDFKIKGSVDISQSNLDYYCISDSFANKKPESKQNPGDSNKELTKQCVDADSLSIKDLTMDSEKDSEEHVPSNMQIPAKIQVSSAGTMEHLNIHQTENSEKKNSAPRLQEVTPSKNDRSNIAPSYEPDTEYKACKVEFNTSAFQSTQSEESIRYANFKLNAVDKLRQQFKIITEKCNDLRFILRQTGITPIILNDEIEKIEQPVFKSRPLDFSLVDVSPFSDEEVKKYLSLVYKFLVSDISGDKMLPVLYHLVRISAVSSVSNLISESYLFVVLFKILKLTKTKQIKIALCTLIGCIFRHKTSENMESSEDDIASHLLTVSADTDPMVNQRALAALGELIFYSASKSKEQNQSWKISTGVLKGILNILKSNKNDIALSYLVKAIENISELVPKIGLLFANDEFVACLVQILSLQKFLYLKIIIIKTLVNLVDLNINLKWCIRKTRTVMETIINLKIPKNNDFTRSKNDLLCLIFIDCDPSFALDHQKSIAPLSKDLLAILNSETENLKSHAILLIVIFLTLDFKFFEIFFNSEGFLHAIETICEKLSVLEMSASTHFTSAFAILLESLQISSDFIHSSLFHLMKIPKTNNPELAAELTYFTHINVQFSKSPILLGILFDETKTIQYLSALDNINLFFLLEIEHSFENYLKTIRRILGSENLIVEFKTRVLQTLILKTQMLLEDPTDTPIRNLTFDVLVNFFMSIQNLGKQDVPVLSTFVKFLTQTFPLQNMEVKLTTMKLLRFLYDKELINSKVTSVVQAIQSIHKETDQTIGNFINKNYFALAFYALAEDSFSIFTLQNHRIFERATRFLVSYQNCNQCEDILGFFNIYLEILYKLIKNKQLKNKIEINGEFIEKLILYLNEMASKMEESYYQDLINILYYIIRVLTLASEYRYLRIAPISKLRLQFFEFLKIFTTRNLSNSSFKKVSKLIPLTKNLKLTNNL